MPGLSLDVRNISWEQWPLPVQSGDVEAVFNNVGVNAERLQLFDLATYRQGIMPFTAGLTVAVGSGTNQERILLDRNQHAVYQASKGAVSIVGTVTAGWPSTTYVAATTLKGNGSVDAVEAGLQHAFDDGSYAGTLTRWGLSDEAVDEPVANPQVAS